MKKYVYPVILFSDADNKSYTVLFPDLDIVASGETVEEAYLDAEDYLKSYLEFATKMENDIVAPTSFVDTQKMNPKRVVLLADAEVSGRIVLSQEEEGYKNFIQKYLYTSED